MARGESGRQLDEVRTWRVALWGFLGGFAPAGLVSAVVLAVGGAAMSAATPLLVLGLLSGGIGALLSGSATAAAKRVGPPPGV